MPATATLLLIVGLPLLSFVVLGIFGRKISSAVGAWLGTLLMAVSALLAFTTAYHYFFSDGLQNGIYQTQIPFEHTWLSFANGLAINMGVILDPISAMMLVVVPLVSLMVHIYSIGYMHGEERVNTYYAFLSLFTFSMLGLVLSSNIFQMYIFWELVGASSFLLIGFYFQKESARAAAKKAFIVTRFADLGFLIGILVVSYYAGSLNFTEIIARLTSPESNELKTATAASFLGFSALSWGLMLVFIGGAGKSAMFPFHIWLPDAMEGPTPVSALIHAATMVVAGVFLVARLFPVYSLSAPEVLHIIAWVGAFSALFAAIIACTQTDIKRVLAYSTMSQIGFMMFALGVSKYGGEGGLGYSASMFHLFTHALFKALLFLGAGAVIHFVHSNEMKDMGGLKKYLPITHITFLIACLAISGIPPFAGFFSKEEILLAAYQNNPAIYWLALVVSMLTAFYMFRLYYNIFWSKPQEQHHAAHGEGGATIMMPLIILAVGAIGAGFIAFGNYVSSDGKPLHTSLHLSFSILPVAAAIIGIAAATMLYRKSSGKADSISQSLGGIYKTAYNKFYIDEIYSFITQSFVFGVVGNLASWIDKNIISGAVNGLGQLTTLTSGSTKNMQSGKLQMYAVYMLLGAIAIAAIMIYLWK